MPAVEELPKELVDRGLEGVALVFGNETRGLKREDLDRCDLVIRVPTDPDFPVLNLAQAVAILVSLVHGAEEVSDSSAPEPGRRAHEPSQREPFHHRVFGSAEPTADSAPTTTPLRACGHYYERGQDSSRDLSPDGVGRRSQARAVSQWRAR